MMLRRRRRIVVAFGLVFALAGCGSDEPSRVIGSDLTILAPAEPGSSLTVSLLGFERGTGPIGVVLAHMLGSNQSAWTLFAEELVKRGFHVLTFDSRGHGGSRGDRSASMAALDLTAAVEKLRALGASKVFVVGASMGGTAAVSVAAAQKLEGVVVLSAPLAIDGLDAGSVVGTLDEPSMFLVGENDEDLYTSAARRLAGGAPEPKRLQILSGTGLHGTDLLTDQETRQRVTDLILDFLIVYRE